MCVFKILHKIWKKVYGAFFTACNIPSTSTGGWLEHFSWIGLSTIWMYQSLSLCHTQHAAAPMKSPAYIFATEPRTTPFWTKEASIDDVTTSGWSLRFLLLCLLPSWAFRVRTGTKSDIWTEVRLLRDEAVEQQVEPRNAEARLREAERCRPPAHQDPPGGAEAKPRCHGEETENQWKTRRRPEERQRGAVGRADRSQSDAWCQWEQQVEELKADLEDGAAELLSTQARVAVNENELRLLRRTTKWLAGSELIPTHL